MIRTNDSRRSEYQNMDPLLNQSQSPKTPFVIFGARILVDQSRLPVKLQGSEEIDIMLIKIGLPFVLIPFVLHV